MKNKTYLFISVLFLANLALGVLLFSAMNDIKTMKAEITQLQLKIETAGSKAAEAANNIKTEAATNKPVKKSAALAISVSEDGFEPNAFQVYLGDAITIELKNNGKQAHSFTVDKLNISETIQPGDSKEITINNELKEPQMLEFYSASNGDTKDIFSGSIMVLER